jgi:hypothetical protein
VQEGLSSAFTGASRTPSASSMSVAINLEGNETDFVDDSSEDDEKTIGLSILF